MSTKFNLFLWTRMSDFLEKTNHPKIRNLLNPVFIGKIKYLF